MFVHPAKRGYWSSALAGLKSVFGGGAHGMDAADLPKVFAQ